MTASEIHCLPGPPRESPDLDPDLENSLLLARAPQTRYPECAGIGRPPSQRSRVGALVEALAFRRVVAWRRPFPVRKAHFPWTVL